MKSYCSKSNHFRYLRNGKISLYKMLQLLLNLGCPTAPSLSVEGVMMSGPWFVNSSTLSKDISASRINESACCSFKSSQIGFLCDSRYTSSTCRIHDCTVSCGMILPSQKGKSSLIEDSPLHSCFSLFNWQSRACHAQSQFMCMRVCSRTPKSLWQCNGGGASYERGATNTPWPGVKATPC